MSEETKVTFTPEQQVLVDKLVGDARVKAREKTTTELAAQATKEKETTDRAALVAEQKWQTLAEQSQARVLELEANEPKVKAYEALIDGMLKDALKVAGDATKKAVESLPASMTAVEKLDWLNKNKELFQAGSDGVGTPRRPDKKVLDKTKSTEISKYPIRL